MNITLEQNGHIVNLVLNYGALQFISDLVGENPNVIVTLNGSPKAQPSLAKELQTILKPVPKNFKIRFYGQEVKNPYHQHITGAVVEKIKAIKLIRRLNIDLVLTEAKAVAENYSGVNFPVSEQVGYEACFFFRKCGYSAYLVNSCGISVEVPYPTNVDNLSEDFQRIEKLIEIENTLGS